MSSRAAQTRRPSPRALADTLTRRTLPRLVVAASQVTLPARVAAEARRRRGGRATVELFFAFDDPCSAVAVIDLAERLAGRPVAVALKPVIRRGIRDDPAVEQKRDYAITDAVRLARRAGMTSELARRTPLPAADTAFLAEWLAGAPAAAGDGGLLDFTTSALRRLWFETGDAPVERVPYAQLWRGRLKGEPHADPAAVTAVERRMSRRGPYETPAAWVAGRWYFAHDRPAQICEWLDELGWAAT